jgi:hypothetical protein
MRDFVRVGFASLPWMEFGSRGHHINAKSFNGWQCNTEFGRRRGEPSMVCKVGLMPSLDHIFLHCSYAKEVWFLSMRDDNLPDVTPSNDDRLEYWSMTARPGHVCRREIEEVLMLVSC